MSCGDLEGVSGEKHVWVIRDLHVVLYKAHTGTYCNISETKTKPQHKTPQLRDAVLYFLFTPTSLMAPLQVQPVELSLHY